MHRWIPFEATPAPSISTVGGATGGTTPLEGWGLAVDAVIAVATIVTLVWAIRSTRREMAGAADDRRVRDEDRSRQVDRERRAQAEQVALWCTSDAVRVEETDEHPADVRRAVHLINASAAPIYRVYIEWWFAFVTPGTREIVRQRPTMSTLQFDVITPGETLDVPVQSAQDVGGGRPRATVWFTDATGTVWRRDDKAGLSLVSNAQPPEADQAPAHPADSGLHFVHPYLPHPRDPQYLRDI
jgi:hypothetical protein